MRMAPWAILYRSSFSIVEALEDTLRLASLMKPLPGPSAPRWKGRRTSKYMPHQGKREVERRRRQLLKIESRRAAELALAA